MLNEMWPPDSATGRLTENKRYSFGHDMKYEFNRSPPRFHDLKVIVFLMFLVFILV